MLVAPNKLIQGRYDLNGVAFKKENTKATYDFKTLNCAVLGWVKLEA